MTTVLSPVCCLDPSVVLEGLGIGELPTKNKKSGGNKVSLLFALRLRSAESIYLFFFMLEFDFMFMSFMSFEIGDERFTAMSLYFSFYSCLVPLESLIVTAISSPSSCSEERLWKVRVSILVFAFCCFEA